MTISNDFNIAYTDGACKGNGKQGGSAGGFGVHITFKNMDVLDIWGGESETTNNRMELMAAITALQNTPPDMPLQLWTDSNYVKDGITKWIDGWKKKGWRKSDGGEVLNQDLWQILDNARQNREIDWQWVKGHAGHAGNERADELANMGVNDKGSLFTPFANKTNSNTQPTDDESSDEKNQMTSPSQSEDTADNTNTSAENQNIEADDQDSNTNTTKTAKKSKKTKTTAPLERHTVQNPNYDGRTDEIREPFFALLPDPVNRGKTERQLVMDTETTGFEFAKGDRIVEIGIVEMIGRKPTGVVLHVYLNPDKEMDDEVIKVHGIQNEFLADKPRFEDVAPFVYEFCKGAEFIAHNANFDMNFLTAEFEQAGYPNFANEVGVIDSLAIARQIYPGQRNTLDALSKRLGAGLEIDRTYHGALKDSQILLEVYLAMTGGQIKLAMFDQDGDGTDDDGELSFMDLSEFAGKMIKSASDFSSDEIWRKEMIKQ